MHKEAANRQSKRRRSLGHVVKKIIALGERPRAIRKMDWCQFGDAIARDINLQKYLENNTHLRALIAKMGGIVEIWRRNYPSAARRAMQRYGPPEYNWRWSSRMGTYNTTQ